MRAHAYTLVALVMCVAADAFYLPGVAPQDYARDDIVFMKVNKLSSTRTQLPFEYYSLPYCRPEKITHSVENLGEVLRGDRIENSLYSFEMRFDEQCKVLCKIDSLTETQSREFAAKIEDEYRVMMILDNLPVAMVRMLQNEEGETLKTYERGFPVGFKANIENGQWVAPDGTNGTAKLFLNNHVRFTVLYHKDGETDLARIVGFEAEPFSVKHGYEQPWNPNKPILETCNPGRMKYVSYDQPPQVVEEGEEIIFTYDVLFQTSEIKWASRWDAYLLMTDAQIHWFSIANSMMIVLFLSGMIALIMLRTLRRDITRYNELETAEEAEEESGWKRIHGDVFRPPTQFGLLSALVGTGFQVMCMFAMTLIFALLGFLSPANRGGLMTAMVMTYVATGFVNGYVSGRFYRFFKGADWKANAALSSFLFPGTIFTVFCILNTLIWGQKSSGAIPFGTFFILIFLWFCVSVPLVFLGSYRGHEAELITDPTRTNKIPRQIPKRAWYMNDAVQILVGGVLPFGAIFIELFFILNSLWLHQFYYVFGFLGLVFIILCVTCAEISVTLCYFQLVAEDHGWWWRAFLTSASSALYLFLYGCHYFSTKLEVTNKISAVLFFGYLFIGSSLFFAMTGAVGFAACLVFVRTIYASVKLD
jgi:transmembrane 9 superfamily protein 2/4